MDYKVKLQNNNIDLNEILATINTLPEANNGITPTGTINITKNGTHDVTNYASAKVNVESSGGNYEIEDAIITGTITEYTNDRVENVGSYAIAGCISLTTVSFPVCKTIGTNAFYECTSLTTVSFPVCTSIGNSAFGYCTSLTTVSFPVCTSIGSSAFKNCTSLTTVNFPVCTSIVAYAFNGCTSLTSVSFPACTSIGSYVFSGCTSLTTVSFPACKTISNYAFTGCTRLISLYLTGSSLCVLGGSKVFTSTPIGGYSTVAGKYGYVYVPASLLTAYKAASYWSTIADRILAYDA